MSFLDWYFLAFMGLLIPGIALHTRHRMIAAKSPSGDGATAGAPLPPLTQLLAGTLLSLLVTGAFAWFVATIDRDVPLFVVARAPSQQDLLLGAIGLALLLLCIPASRAIRSEEEIRNMNVLQLAPRTAQERALFAAVAIAAGVCEELAWRGTFWSLLTMQTGLWPAAIVASVLFAIAHAMQGWKSMIFIFLTALILHWLTWATGALVVPMVVHALYDVVAVVMVARLARRYEVAPPVVSAP